MTVKLFLLRNCLIVLTSMSYLALRKLHRRVRMDELVKEEGSFLKAVILVNLDRFTNFCPSLLPTHGGRKANTPKFKILASPFMEPFLFMNQRVQALSTFLKITEQKNVVMKWSAFSFIFMACFFLACDKRPKRLMVRPLEGASDSMYSTIFPFDTQPSLQFGKRIFSKKNERGVPDTLFTNRIRINPIAKNDLDANTTFPAVALDVLMPDSVELGNGFYYLMVLKAREGAQFSRLHMAKVASNHYRIRTYQQELEGVGKPRNEFEEMLRSFYPDEKGRLKFEYFYYDSLLLEREVVVF